ncbi:MAG: hypothetical protein IJM17_06235 [Firmicutes bacterium]|nr:hypothetical protein [Bacillota bacterium]
MTKKTLSIAGAYTAWVMGSGFATGQEIFQFFTSYGYMSYVILLVNLAGFLAVGTAVTEAGQAHGNDPGFDHFRFFCGEKLGGFYSWLLPVNMFGLLSVMLSGAGTALNEYYGLERLAGSLIMSLLVYFSYVIGFKRFVKIVSFLGPMVMGFTLLVGLLTVIREPLSSEMTEKTAQALASRRPVPFWWLSAVLYVSYNLWTGSKYYSALGAEAPTRREASLGAVLGTAGLMLGILLMNTAMLSRLEDVMALGVPTLYLAGRISYGLGAAFSVLLLMGIFSTASTMLWMICEKLTVQGTKKGNIIAFAVTAVTFLLGLLPFSALVGTIYTVSGYLGLIAIACFIRGRLRKG